MFAKTRVYGSQFEAMLFFSLKASRCHTSPFINTAHNRNSITAALHSSSNPGPGHSVRMFPNKIYPLLMQIDTAPVFISNCSLRITESKLFSFLVFWVAMFWPEKCNNVFKCTVSLKQTIS